MKKQSKYTSAFTSLYLLFFLAIFPAAASNQAAGVVKIDRCEIENNTFQVGEELTYKIYYNWNFVWIPAGEVVFKISDKGSEYIISADGTTYASYEWFFKVRDHYESHIDKKTLLPSLSLRDVKEGGYTLYDKTEIDQKNQKATIERGRAKDNINENKSVDIDHCMHDILSVLYFARNINYDNIPVNSKIPVKFFMDKKEWPLQVKYTGHEASTKIKGQGRYNTIRFSPEVIAGDIFEENTEMNVWVSDDKNKVPLMIESPISVGSVKVVLKDSKGLKHPMNSFVK